MLTLQAVLGLAVLTYSIARWDRPGQPFHSLLQFLSMGVNGAFLTGDLFDLFVFVEILLAASYGLALRGVGATRVGMGLHYLVVNIISSMLFLVGVAMIYGVAGTLNMADLARRFTTLAPDARTLFDTGAAILGVAFLIKAGSWPLNFWLPGTYSAAVAPVGAAFAMLTKVGVYALMRVGTLMSEDEAAASMLGLLMFYFGLATLVTGTIGMLASHHLARLVSYSLVASTNDNGARFRCIARVPGIGPPFLSRTSAVVVLTVTNSGGLIVPNSLRRELYTGLNSSAAISTITNGQIR